MSKEDAKRIVKLIKDKGAKVQAAIMVDIVRVTGKKIDDLQEIIQLCKTEGRNLGDSGSNVGIVKGPKHAGSKGGKKNIDMKTMGRGMAKVAAQKRG